MFKPSPKPPRPHILRQHDQTDCGVACLLSLVEFYGGSSNLETLRRLSGTNVTGTTLLGLYQAANAVGFAAEGCEADLEALMAHPSPVILHVVIDGYLQHYVVCYGHTVLSSGEVRFTIGDPAKGLEQYTVARLQAVWQSKACLILDPTPKLVKAKTTQAAKRRWLRQLLQDDVQLLLIAALLGVALALLGMAMALFSQRLIDDFLPNKKTGKLFLGIGLLAALLLTKELLSLLRQRLLLQQSRAFNTRIITSFFSHLLGLPKAFFDTRQLGDFTARLHDTSRIQRVISQLAGSALVDLLMVLVTTAFLFTYSWRMALSCLLAIPVFFLLVFSRRRALIAGQQQTMKGYAAVEGHYISTLQGIEAIKNHGKQGLFGGKNTGVYAAYQQALVHLGYLQIKLGLVANTFSVLFLTAVLAYGSHLALKGGLQMGELIAILGLCGNLLPSVANLALLAVPLNEAKIAFDRMFEFTGTALEHEIALSETDTEVPIREVQSLVVNNLSFRFAGRSPLLQRISLELYQGEVVAIAGESGSGKSTLLQLLLRNYEPEEGSITVNSNQPLQGIGHAQWRRLCVTVPQRVHLFNGTVLQNIGFEDADANPQKVVQFLTDYGFDIWLQHLPQHVLTLVGEEGINLSGGQQQLVALARALYAQPSVLILDEATSAMDMAMEQWVIQVLQRLKPKMGIIFITHRLHLLPGFCQRIYVLQQGCVAAAGTHVQLMDSENLYSRYWHSFVNPMQDYY